MEKNTIFCQIEFLKHFFSEKPKNEDDFYSDTFHNWLSLRKLLVKHSYLILDVERKVITELSAKNPLFHELLDSIIKGNSELIYLPKEFENMEVEDDCFLNKTNEIFLLSKSEEECKELEKKHGLIFISKDNIQKSKFLFESAIIPIEKEKQNYNNWSFFQQFKHPFNAMVIADNYLLNIDKRPDLIDNSKKQVVENIIGLLKNIMPKQLNKTFQLTFIIAVDKKVPSIDIESIHELIETELSFLDYDVCVTIIRYKYEAELHDRNIITNYAWISSGYGFKLFKNKKITKDTHLSFYPITFLQTKYSGYYEQNNSQEKLNSIIDVYNFLRKQFKNANDIDENTGVVEFSGNKENRLLS